MTAVAAQASPRTDIDLLRAHLGGSRDAFGQLVASHVDMVYSAALRQVRDPHLADDVTQAVFLLLWQKAPALREGIFLPARCSHAGRKLPSRSAGAFCHRSRNTACVTSSAKCGSRTCRSAAE